MSYHQYYQSISIRLCHLINGLLSCFDHHTIGAIIYHITILTHSRLPAHALHFHFRSMYPYLSRLFRMLLTVNSVSLYRISHLSKLV
jgi:hypothetical protein